LAGDNATETEQWQSWRTRRGDTDIAASVRYAFSHARTDNMRVRYWSILLHFTSSSSSSAEKIQTTRGTMTTQCEIVVQVPGICLASSNAGEIVILRALYVHLPRHCVSKHFLMLRCTDSAMLL